MDAMLVLYLAWGIKTMIIFSPLSSYEVEVSFHVVLWALCGLGTAKVAASGPTLSISNYLPWYFAVPL